MYNETQLQICNSLSNNTRKVEGDNHENIFVEL